LYLPAAGAQGSSLSHLPPKEETDKAIETVKKLMKSKDEEIQAFRRRLPTALEPGGSFRQGIRPKSGEGAEPAGAPRPQG